MAQYLDLDGLKTLVSNVNNKFVKKGEVDNTFVEVLTDISKLPTTNIRKHIYLVPETGASGVANNRYAEYVYTGTLPIVVDETTHNSNYDASKWEKLGYFQAKVDLTAYSKKVDTVNGVAAGNNDASNIKINVTKNSATSSISIPSATTSAAGAMSASDKTKLDGIAEEANKTIVDNFLNSTSTNPVQNKIVNAAISGKVSTATYNSLAFSPNTPFSTSEDGQQFIGLAFGDNDTHDNKSTVEIYSATQTKPGIMSTADKKKLDGIAEHANYYSLPVAGTNLGGIKLGYSASDKNYPVQVDSANKAYVYVPWIDTKYSLPTATNDVLGGIKIGFEQDDVNRNYPIALNTSNQAYVNLPLATYNILDNTGQKDGLITGAERRAIHLLSLSSKSLSNNGGLQLTLNGVIEDNNGTVVIPFATSEMSDVSYGLMMGSDKKKLDNITSIKKSEIDKLFT